MALLKEDGASDEDIAIALDQKMVAMARHYSAEANRRKRMTAAMLKFDPLKRNKLESQLSNSAVQRGRVASCRGGDGR